MARKPHDWCWQLSATQSLLFSPSSSPIPMHWKTRQSKEKQQMSHSFWYPEPSTGWSPVLGMLFGGECVLVESALWMGRVQNASRGKQLVSKDISRHPVHSRWFYQSVCVCVDIHMQARASLPLQYIWIGWMAYWLCISLSSVQAGRQIMRQQPHCWHQMTLFNKRYRQSADLASFSLDSLKRSVSVFGLLYL